MTSESRLVHIVDEIPELEAVTDLTMVLVLDGFLDAGNSAALACRYLTEVSAGQTGVMVGRESTSGSSGSVVATFDVDQFHDYRARRPPMSFVGDHYADYEAPRLVVRLMRDSADIPYLLMHGPEPDNRWEAFARAVREVIERFDVSRVVGMGSVPMAVPHTRPIAITHHANNNALISGDSPWRGELRIPSSAQALLEVRLGEWGHDGLGYVAHIPHYLAQLDYPRASVALLEQVELGGHLTIDLTGLRESADEREEDVTRYLAANEEIADVVRALEQQYDSFEEAEESGRSLLADDTPLPTGDEIGQQFEQFLAGLDEDRPDSTRNPEDD